MSEQPAPHVERPPCWSRTHPIAFISNQATVFEWEIYIMTAEGKGPTRLGQGQFRAPTWSPDGRSIAFRRYRADPRSLSQLASEIGLMAPDGTQAVTLLQETEFEPAPIGQYTTPYGPTWSADGEQLAFASVRGGRSRVWSISRFGGEPIEVIPGFEFPQLWARFSPTAAYELAFVALEAATEEIWRVDTRDPSTARRLTQGDVQAPEGLRWSPDGRRLAFSAEATRGDPASREIYILDIADGTLSRITDNAAVDGEPAWSPDARHLVVTSDRARLGRDGPGVPADSVALWWVPLDDPHAATPLTARPGAYAAGDWAWNAVCD